MNYGIPLRKSVMTPGCHLASVFFRNLEPMLKFQILTSKGLGKWATSHIHIVFSRPVLRLYPPGLILLNTTQNDLPFPVLCDQHTLTNEQPEMPLIDPSF